MNRVLFLAPTLAVLAATAQAEPLNAWIAYGSDALPHLRAIAEPGAACPAARADDHDLPLTPRMAPDQAFPVTVCDGPLPKGAIRVSVGGIDLRAPVAEPRRIVVLGDTGCRIKGVTVQSCNDPKAWPFPTLAANAARENPDLIIHVGDYHYRESPCPAGIGRCDGSPWGDNWTTWNADFFTPAKPLLTAAPWVMIRGNHESCQRAGQGWTHLLDPDAANPGRICNPAHKPYGVPLGGVTLAVIDDADAGDTGTDAAGQARLRHDLDEFAGLPALWLGTHHPPHGVFATLPRTGLGANPALSAILGTQPPANLGLMLSGHIHLFQASNFDNGMPPQLVAGNGGDTLDSLPVFRLDGLSSGQWTIHDGVSAIEFGYLVFERDGAAWTITAHRADASVLTRCRLANKRIDCR